MIVDISGETPKGTDGNQIFILESDEECSSSHPRPAQAPRSEATLRIFQKVFSQPALVKDRRTKGGRRKSVIPTQGTRNKRSSHALSDSNNENTNNTRCNAPGAKKPRTGGGTHEGECEASASTSGAHAIEEKIKDRGIEGEKGKKEKEKDRDRDRDPPGSLIALNRTSGSRKDMDKGAAPQNTPSSSSSSSSVRPGLRRRHTSSPRELKTSDNDDLELIITVDEEEGEEEKKQPKKKAGTRQSTAGGGKARLKRRGSQSSMDSLEEVNDENRSKSMNQSRPKRGKSSDDVFLSSLNHQDPRQNKKTTTFSTSVLATVELSSAEAEEHMEHGEAVVEKGEDDDAPLVVVDGGHRKKGRGKKPDVVAAHSTSIRSNADKKTSEKKEDGGTSAAALDSAIVPKRKARCKNASENLAVIEPDGKTDEKAITRLEETHAADKATRVSGKNNGRKSKGGGGEEKKTVIKKGKLQTGGLKEALLKRGGARGCSGLLGAGNTKGEDKIIERKGKDTIGAMKSNGKGRGKSHGKKCPSVLTHSIVEEDTDNASHVHDDACLSSSVNDEKVEMGQTKKKVVKRGTKGKLVVVNEHQHDGEKRSNTWNEGEQKEGEKSSFLKKKREKAEKEEGEKSSFLKKKRARIAAQKLGQKCRQRTRGEIQTLKNAQNACNGGQGLEKKGQSVDMDSLDTAQRRGEEQDDVLQGQKTKEKRRLVISLSGSSDGSLPLVLKNNNGSSAVDEKDDKVNADASLPPFSSSSSSSVMRPLCLTSDSPSWTGRGVVRPGTATQDDDDDDDDAIESKKMERKKVIETGNAPARSAIDGKCNTPFTQIMDHSQQRSPLSYQRIESLLELRSVPPSGTGSPMWRGVQENGRGRLGAGDDFASMTQTLELLFDGTSPATQGRLKNGKDGEDASMTQTSELLFDGTSPATQGRLMNGKDGEDAHLAVCLHETPFCPRSDETKKMRKDAGEAGVNENENENEKEGLGNGVGIDHPEPRINEAPTASTTPFPQQQCPFPRFRGVTMALRPMQHGESGGRMISFTTPSPMVPKNAAVPMRARGAVRSGCPLVSTTRLKKITCGGVQEQQQHQPHVSTSSSASSGDISETRNDQKHENQSPPPPKETNRLLHLDEASWERVNAALAKTPKPTNEERMESEEPLHKEHVVNGRKNTLIIGKGKASSSSSSSSSSSVDPSALWRKHHNPHNVEKNTWCQASRWVEKKKEVTQKDVDEADACYKQGDDERDISDGACGNSVRDPMVEANPRTPCSKEKNPLCETNGMRMITATTPVPLQEDGNNATTIPTTMRTATRIKGTSFDGAQRRGEKEKTKVDPLHDQFQAFQEKVHEMEKTAVTGSLIDREPDEETFCGELDPSERQNTEEGRNAEDTHRARDKDPCSPRRPQHSEHTMLNNGKKASKSMLNNGKKASKSMRRENGEYHAGAKNGSHHGGDTGGTHKSTDRSDINSSHHAAEHEVEGNKKTERRVAGPDAADISTTTLNVPPAASVKVDENTAKKTTVTSSFKTASFDGEIKIRAGDNFDRAQAIDEALAVPTDVRCKENGVRCPQAHTVMGTDHTTPSKAASYCVGAGAHNAVGNTVVSLFKTASDNEVKIRKDSLNRAQAFQESLTTTTTTTTDSKNIKAQAHSLATTNHEKIPSLIRTSSPNQDPDRLYCTKEADCRADENTGLITSLFKTAGKKSEIKISKDSLSRGRAFEETLHAAHIPPETDDGHAAHAAQAPHAGAGPLSHTNAAGIASLGPLHIPSPKVDTPTYPNHPSHALNPKVDQHQNASNTIVSLFKTAGTKGEIKISKASLSRGRAFEESITTPTEERARENDPDAYNGAGATHLPSKGEAGILGHNNNCGHKFDDDPSANNTVTSLFKTAGTKGEIKIRKEYLDRGQKALEESIMEPMTSVMGAPPPSRPGPVVDHHQAMDRTGGPSRGAPISSHHNAAQQRKKPTFTAAPSPVPSAPTNPQATDNASFITSLFKTAGTKGELKIRKEDVDLGQKAFVEECIFPKPMDEDGIRRGRENGLNGDKSLAHNIVGKLEERCEGGGEGEGKGKEKGGEMTRGSMVPAHMVPEFQKTMDNVEAPSSSHEFALVEVAEATITKLEAREREGMVHPIAAPISYADSRSTPGLVAPPYGVPFNGGGGGHEHHLRGEPGEGTRKQWKKDAKTHDEVSLFATGTGEKLRLKKEVLHRASSVVDMNTFSLWGAGSRTPVSEPEGDDHPYNLTPIPTHHNDLNGVVDPAHARTSAFETNHGTRLSSGILPSALGPTIIHSSSAAAPSPPPPLRQPAVATPFHLRSVAAAARTKSKSRLFTKPFRAPTAKMSTAPGMAPQHNHDGAAMVLHEHGNTKCHGIGAAMVLHEHGGSASASAQEDQKPDTSGLCLPPDEPTCAFPDRTLDDLFHAFHERLRKEHNGHAPTHNCNGAWFSNQYRVLGRSLRARNNALGDPEVLIERAVRRWHVENEGRRSPIRTFLEDGVFPPSGIIVQVVSSAPLEITDGWYFARCEADELLLPYLCKDLKVRVLEPTRIQMEGVSPLEACSEVTMKLHYNTCGIMDCQARLGKIDCTSHPGSTRFADVKPNGGNVSLMDVICVRELSTNPEKPSILCTDAYEDRQKEDGFFPIVFNQRMDVTPGSRLVITKLHPSKPQPGGGAPKLYATRFSRLKCLPASCVWEIPLFPSDKARRLTPRSISTAVVTATSDSSTNTSITRVGTVDDHSSTVEVQEFSQPVRKGVFVDLNCVVLHQEEIDSRQQGEKMFIYYVLALASEDMLCRIQGPLVDAPTGFGVRWESLMFTKCDFNPHGLPFDVFHFSSVTAPHIKSAQQEDAQRGRTMLSQLIPGLLM